MPIFKEQDVFAGRYQLIKHLGSGGFAEVWKAKDLMADEVEIAIKIYAPERGLDEQGIRLFRKEYSNTASLNHTHLLTPKHFDVHDGSPYLIMPYCPGGNLMDRIIDEKKFTEKELLGVFTPLVEALAYLHGKGVIHQDIKPHNILLDEDGQYVLADFGISGRMRRTIAARTQMANKQTASFTPAYAPPERITTKPSPEWDIFSLGVTMYELATGDLPFEDTGLALNHDSEVPLLPQPWSKNISNILRSCLSKNPADRPKAKELLAELLGLQTGTASPVAKKKKSRRKTEVYHGAIDIAEPEKTIKERPSKTKTTSKKKLRPAWIALALVAIFGVAGLANWMNVRAKKKASYLSFTQEAATFLNNNEFDKALTAYENAYQILPNEFEAQQGKRNVHSKAYDYYMERGNNLFQQKYYGKAASEYAQALEYYPTDETAGNQLVNAKRKNYVKRARAFRSIKDYNLAIENCDSALNIAPGDQRLIALKDSLVTERVGNSLVIGEIKPLTDLLIDIDNTIKETVPIDIKLKDYEIVDKDGNPLTIRRIKKNGKYGFINAINQVTVQPIYDELFPYSDGLFSRARFKKNGKFGYLDILGKEIIPAQFASADDFKGGKARVSHTKLGFLILDTSPDFGKPGKAFYIDINGKRIN